MNAFLADTNFILRFLLADVPSQTKIARDYFKKAQARQISIYLPLLVFVELDYALSKFYRFPKGEVAKKLKSIANVPYLEIEKREAVQRALDHYQRRNIELVDLIFYFEAKNSGMVILTFDRRLKKLTL